MDALHDKCRHFAAMKLDLFVSVVVGIRHMWQRNIVSSSHMPRR